MPKSEQEKLLDSILKYIVPKLKKKFIKDKQSRLEELLEKPKLKSFKLFLDDIINGSKSNKPIKKLEIIELFKTQKNNNKIKEEEIRYAAVFQRKTEEENSLSYSVEIKYEETETEEKLSVKVKFNNYSLEDNPINQNKPIDDYLINKKSLDNYSISKNTTKKDQNEGKKEYFFEIKKEKDSKTKDNYSVSLIYENNYEEERLSINYRSTLGAYLNKRQDALHNFEDRVPGKHVDILPASVMGGILGFTYLGQDRMTLRDDLIGDKRMVDIHESIHTPDEYETRVLTDWIMSKPNSKYIK